MNVLFRIKGSVCSDIFEETIGSKRKVSSEKEH